MSRLELSRRVCAFGLLLAPLAACSASQDAAPSATMDTTLAAVSCPAMPAGVVVGGDNGDHIQDFKLRDCNDNEVSLSRFCNADATWLYVVHTWCPHTKKVGSWTEKIAELEKPKGVASISIVWEGDTFQPPTAADCRKWSQTYGTKDAVVLYDPTQSVQTLFDSNTTSLSVYLDKHQVIRSKTHTDDPTEIESRIDDALSVP